MMNENIKTYWFIGVAAALVLIAFLLSPSRIVPTAFADQGDVFFPNFTDPNTATSLEIFNFDENSGSAQPFKVTFKDGLWTIPSHFDYPADAKDRLAKTAAAIIGIRKDDFRSDNVADQEVCGVVDPTDENAPGLTGRGQLIVLKDSNDNILANFIIGKQVPNRSGFRFVRIPGQKRIYAARTDIDISTNFSDWINTDLLQLNKPEINRVDVNDYSIDESTGRLNQRDDLILTLGSKDHKWKANNQNAGQQVDSAKMDSFLKAIDNLKIVGVRPKPPGLSANLTQAAGENKITMNDKMSLQSKGFYFTRDGDLKSNEGELVVRSNEGIVYTLRFGEVLYGSGMDETSGSKEKSKDKGAAENRYLFITCAFDPSIFPEPSQPKNLDFLNTPDSLLTDSQKAAKKEYDKYLGWKRQIEKGQKLNEQLNNRFAGWYYVISADSFEKLKVNRKDLVISKNS